MLVNIAAPQKGQRLLTDSGDEQFERTLMANVGGAFRMIGAAVPHLKDGASIINTGSIVGEVGNTGLVD